jgi:hypothetical protein
MPSQISISVKILTKLIGKTETFNRYKMRLKKMSQKPYVFEILVMRWFMRQNEKKPYLRINT